MITLGIDLSSQRAGTAACLIDWQREKVVVSEPQAGCSDRSGDGHFFEIYPAASLHAWGISNRGYKQAKDEACVAARAKILTELRVRLPQLELPSSAAATSDTLDSLIASLTTRAAAIGRARRPGSELIELARTEGWIHVPIGPMAEDLAAEA